MAKYRILNNFLLSLFGIGGIVSLETEYVQQDGFPLVYSNQDSAIIKQVIKLSK